MSRTEEVRRRAAAAIAARWCEYLEATPAFDSPIEELFYYGLIEAVAGDAEGRLIDNARRGSRIRHSFENGRIVSRIEGRRELALCDAAADLPFECGLRRNHVLLYPQVAVGRYRADFVIVGQGPFSHVVSLAIECDGHAYHERTKEQARHDRARDRAFLEAGLPVFRFTGSEIHRAPGECGEQALRFLWEEARRLEETIAQEAPVQ